MIHARHLTKRYGDAVVLDGISFDVETGERIGILGTNGAGKTTLLRCLLGLTAFQGTLEVDGLPAGPGAVEVRGRIGYVPQHPPVLDLTLGELFDLVAGVRGIRVERAVSRHRPIASKGSSARPSGSMRAWQEAHAALLRCFSSCSRRETDLPRSFSSRAGTSGGGGGGGAPRRFSRIHLPRSTGEVRLGYDETVRTLACRQTPPRPLPVRSTLRKSCPLTFWMP